MWFSEMENGPLVTMALKDGRALFYSTNLGYPMKFSLLPLLTFAALALCD